MLECCWDPTSSNSRHRCHYQRGRCTGACSFVHYNEKAHQPKFCEGNICRADECCEDAVTCATFGCGNVSSRYLDKLAPPSYCKDAACTVEECCDSAGTCAGIRCYPWDGLIEKINATAYCMDTTCTTSEC